MRLNKEFYQRDTRRVAKDLLGKILVRKIDGKLLKGRIVETEAYIGELDKACHAYGGKRTERTELLYGEPGLAYVYFIYGLYHCFNLITERENYASGVLIRAIEPLEEIETICELRFKKSHKELSKYEKKNISNGPSKLCMAMNITKADNGVQTLISDKLYIEEPTEKYKLDNLKIVRSKRIGIDYAEEAKDFLWRYYIEGNPYISKI